MKISNLVLVLGLFGSAAYAGGNNQPSPVICHYVKADSGLHTVSTDQGELGDNEDGSPVVVPGYLLTVQCNSLTRSLFFFLNNEPAEVARELNGVANGSVVDLSEEEVGGGMEGQAATVIQGVTVNGNSISGLNGAELVSGFQIVK